MATVTTRICVTNDTHTFQCCADEGSLFLYFGVKNREYIFEHFGREEIEHIRHACDVALADLSDDVDQHDHP